ncbi:MAG: hypothetical protein OJF50_005957 [Nitrospira sp.]|nr:hypothetical protein [Nitrospira sp.]
MVGFDLDGTLLRGENYQFSWELIWNNLKFAKKIQQGLSREYRNKPKRRRTTDNASWLIEPGVRRRAGIS